MLVWILDMNIVLLFNFLNRFEAFVYIIHIVNPIIDILKTIDLLVY